MKKKIKVLHVVSSYENSEGGPPIAVNNLAYSLRNSNLIENSLITTGIKKEKIKHFKKVSIGKLLLKKFYIPNLSTIFRLNKEIKENNLIHLHNFWNFIIFFGLFLSLLHNKKIILSPHGSFDNYNMNKVFTFIFLLTYVIFLCSMFTPTKECKEIGYVHYSYLCIKYCKEKR